MIASMSAMALLLHTGRDRARILLRKAEHHGTPRVELSLSRTLRLVHDIKQVPAPFPQVVAMSVG